MNKEEKIIKTLKTTIVTLTVLSLFNFIGIANTSYSLFNTTKNTKTNINIKTYANSYCKSEKCNFDFTGTDQLFIAPQAGKYKLETWGAQGGTDGSTYHGGYGGYAIGNISLKKNEKIYVFVGEKGYGGLTTPSDEGIGVYPNGGKTTIYDPTNNIMYSSGGGSTHIALTNTYIENMKNDLNKLLIVSGAGGGVSNWWNEGDNGGNGGGFNGTTTTKNFANYAANDTNDTIIIQANNNPGYGTQTSVVNQEEI